MYVYILTYVCVQHGHVSYRVEMKKFQDAKQPLTFLEHKLGIKALSQEAFKVFQTELSTIVKEQTKFLTALEYKLAVAESTDKIQAFNDPIKTKSFSSEISSCQFVGQLFFKEKFKKQFSR